MTLDALLAQLFGSDAAIEESDHTFSGEAAFQGRSLCLIGTAGGAPLSARRAHRLAGAILAELRGKPPRPILMMLDNLSQELALAEELIGNCRYFAHLAQCLDLARRQGRPTLALVYRQAVSGGFLAAGMSAERCFALPQAELRVMHLAAMARITRLPLERLAALQATSPVFAPGVDKFHALGVIEAIWKGDLRTHLADALASGAGANWRQQGRERGGRLLAAKVADDVLRSD